MKITFSNVLVEEDRIAVRIHDGKGSWTAGLPIHLTDKNQAFFFQLALKFAHIREIVKLFGVLIPTRVEGQDNFLKSFWSRSIMEIFFKSVDNQFSRYNQWEEFLSI